MWLQINFSLASQKNNNFFDQLISTSFFIFKIKLLSEIFFYPSFRLIQKLYQARRFHTKFQLRLFQLPLRTYNMGMLVKNFNYFKWFKILDNKVVLIIIENKMVSMCDAMYLKLIPVENVYSHFLHKYLKLFSNQTKWR